MEQIILKLYIPINNQYADITIANSINNYV